MIISAIVKLTKSGESEIPAANTMVPWLPWSPTEDIEDNTDLKEKSGTKNQSYRDSEEEPKFDKF